MVYSRVFEGVDQLNKWCQEALKQTINPPMYYHPVSRIRKIFACGIQWNSGLTMGIRNLVSSTIRNPELSTDSIWNPEAKAWNPESKTVLDNFTWGEMKKQVFPGQWLR